MAADGRLKFLEDKWDEAVAAKLDAPELLRYRSNLLGSDLRITNFGGGNTSSKLDEMDPVNGRDGQGALGKGVRWRSGQYQARRLRDALSGSAAGAGEAVQGRGGRGCDGGSLSSGAHSTTIPRRLRSIRRCMASFRLPMSIIFIPTGESPWLPRRTASRRWRSSTRSSATSSPGCRGSDRASSWA